MSLERDFPRRVGEPERASGLPVPGLNGGTAEEVLDRLVSLSARALGVPVALLSFVVDGQELLANAVGLPGARLASRSTASLGASVIEAGQPVRLGDARSDPRFQQLPAVRELGIAAYLGVPVHSTGSVKGALCVLDFQPREWTDEDVTALDSLAGAVEAEIERRRATASARQVAAGLGIELSGDAVVPELFERIAGRLDALEADRRALEEQLQQSQKMEVIGRLAAGVAHDFNNMLAVISGYGELLSEVVHPESPLAPGLGEIRRARERASTLTRQLLAFSRKAALEPSLVDLGEVLRGMHPMLRRLIGEDIDLRVAVATDPGRIRANAGQIEQVVMNLAVNARDAMPQGGRLEIQVRTAQVDTAFVREHPELRPGPHVLLEVTDTGVGMSAETLERIFEPFYTTKPAGHGTGLGLMTVLGIVRQWGAHVLVESELGRGATFRIYFPAAQETLVHRTVETPAPLSGTETVLLLEDEPMVRNLVRHLLEIHGYTVLEAATGDQALLASASHPGRIDLLLADVVIPGGLSGVEIAERLRASRPGVKVLFMSGYTDDEVIRRGVSRGEVPFVQKPFTPAVLARRVREVLDEAPPTSEPARECRLLVVDDSADMRETLADALQELGYIVATVPDGRTALDHLHRNPPPDLILLDLVMRGMNGWVFRMEQLRDPQLAKIPVVVLSGAHDPGPAAEFLHAEAHLPKPIDLELLLETVERLCGLTSARPPTAIPDDDPVELEA
jgi:signal transduction histidine kinase/CheY-like chemotaxis protein